MQFKSKAEIFNLDNATSFLKYLFFGYLLLVSAICFLEMSQKEHVANVFETVVKNEGTLDQLTYVELASSKNTELFEGLYSKKAIAFNALIALLTVPLWVSAFLMKKSYLAKLGAMTLFASSVYSVAGVYANGYLEDFFQKANERSLVSQSKISGKIINIGQVICKSDRSATCSVELTVKSGNSVHKIPLNVFKHDLDTRLEVEFIENTYLSKLTKEKSIEYTVN